MIRRFPAAELASFRGHFGDGIHSVFEKAPVAIQIVYGTRKPACCSNQRDGFVEVDRAGRLEFPFQTVNFAFKRVNGFEGLPEQISISAGAGAIDTHLESDTPF